LRLPTALERRPYLTELPLVLAIAAMLRFYTLPQRGLIYWDEAKFALEGIRAEALIRSPFAAHVSLAVGKSIGTAKPTHALLIALAYLLFGVHDYSALFLNAAASTAGIGLTYFAATRLFCRPVGLLAALFLAVSEFDVIYARSALSESDATTILLVAILIWLAGVKPQDGAWRILAERRWTVLASGALLGVAFTTNYRLLVYGGALVFFDLGWNLGQLGRLGTARRALLWVLGFALAPACWQIADLVTRAHGLELFRSEGTHQAAWYLQEAIYQLHQGKQSAVNFNPVPYIQWFALRQGIPMALLTLAGIICAFRRRTFPYLLTITLVGLPYLLYITAPFIVPRNLVPMLPFASIMAAGAIFEARSAVSGRWPALVLLGIAVLAAIVGASRAWQLTNERSGYALAASYVSTHDAGRALTGNEQTVFYLRGTGTTCDAPRLPFRKPRLGDAIRQGFEYAIFDRYLASPLEPYVRAHAHLEARFSAVGNLDVGENLISSENTNPPDASERQDIVAVYRLTRLKVEATSRPAAPIFCNRDVPN
jgi:4-amino-4-deoxy-L-arabinose transferase-like glycosyltransferase